MTALPCCDVHLQVDDLVAKSQANKALNDKKRAATSSANLARSR
jgi:photosystem I subunit PsaN